MPIAVHVQCNYIISTIIKQRTIATRWYLITQQKTGIILRNVLTCTGRKVNQYQVFLVSIAISPYPLNDNKILSSTMQTHTHFYNQRNINGFTLIEVFAAISRHARYKCPKSCMVPLYLTRFLFLALTSRIIQPPS